MDLWLTCINKGSLLASSLCNRSPFFGRLAYRQKRMELVAQNAIDQIIGHAELKVARESNAPTIAPMPKRKVPASEDAVPAIWGNSSRMTAIALDDTIDTHPTNAATPTTSDQNPRPSSALMTIHAATINWIHNPARNIFNAPIRRTKRLLKMVITNRKTMFSAK